MPKVVSDRMLRRMAVFCGTPTALGLAAFPTSYLLLQQGIKIPVPVVVVVTLGLFGLGMVGLSYGILSLLGCGPSRTLARLARISHQLGTFTGRLSQHQSKT